MSINLVYIGFIAFIFMIMCGPLSALIRRHPLSIPIIWYTFSLSFCCTALAHYVVAALKLGETHPAANEFIVWLVHISMDIQGEFYLLAAVFFVAIVPQILGYILSGISGVAEQPRFISQFTSMMTWFMAKAFAFLAGIYLQFGLFPADNPFQRLQMERGGFFAATAFSLMIAFSLVVARHDMEDILRAIITRAPALQRANGWMQRNLKAESAPRSYHTKNRTPDTDPSGQ